MINLIESRLDVKLNHPIVLPDRFLVTAIACNSLYPLVNSSL
jgi:hypothetical protein